MADLFDKFHMAQKSTRPSGPKTGRVVRGCLAAPLEDCSGKLSQEHYISKGLLTWLNEAGDSFGMPGASLIAIGLPGLAPQERRSLPPSAVNVKIFCERHNNALSNIDDEGIRFFKTIFDITTELNRGQVSLIHDVRMFNGHDLERWLLKALCGIAAFGAAHLFPAEASVSVAVEPEWIEILFDLKSFTDRRGLYCPNTPGAVTDGRVGFDLDPLTNGTSLAGLGTVFMGLAFNLFMRPGLSPHQLALGGRHAFRPSALVLFNDKAPKEITLSWDLRGDDVPIRIRVHPPG